MIRLWNLFQRSRGLALALLAAAACSAALALTADALPTVEELIRRLDSDDYDTREAAVRALLERDEAEPALRRALLAPSLDLRRLAQRVLDERTELLSRRRMQPILDSFKTGQLDLLPEQMALLEEHLDDRTWETLFSLITRIIDKANRDGGKRIPFPDINRFRGRKPANTRDKLDSYRWVSHQRLVVPEITKREIIDSCVIISRGAVEASIDFKKNIIIANGNLVVNSSIDRCIVICDGSVQAKFIGSSIVIATGKVKSDDAYSVVLENARDALGLVRFFDTKQAGIVVAEEKGAVKVQQVLDDLSFARAGVRAGDRIVAIDGVKVGDTVLPPYRAKPLRYKKGPPAQRPTARNITYQPHGAV